MMLLLSWLAASLALATEPDFRSGDLVFQTSGSSQSYAIMWASKSLYSHVGLVEVTPRGNFVLEAISRVSRTPLKKWISRGRLGRYAVYRDEALSSEDRRKLVAEASKFLGRPYDIYFSSKNREIYCSELVDLAYSATGHPIGVKQKVKELDVDNPIVRSLVKKRWRKHPACRSEKTFDGCWPTILDDELISPDGLTRDSRLKRIWTNYP